MNLEEQELKLYKNSQGEKPFSNWYEQLKDSNTKQIVLARLTRVRLGNFGDCQSVGAGVLELRIHFRSGLRIYFGRDGSRIVVLLVGGNKSTQKRDIKRAHKFWNNYKEKKYANRKL